jgi:signal transduction histidine kinase
MKTLTFLFCCLLASVHIFAQEKDVDYIRQLSEAKNDSIRAEIYIHAMRHYSTHNSDSLKYYSDQGIAHFRKNKNRLGEGLILEQLAIADQAQGRMNIARQRIQYTLSIFKELGYKPGIARVTGNMGALEASSGNYDLALKYLLESLRLEDSTADNEIRMTGYMNIAAIYMQTGDTANAGKYLNIALEIANDNPLSEKKIGLYNIIGVLHAFKGEKEEALATFLRNLELSDHPSFVEAHVECLSYIGQYYLEDGQLDKGLSYLRRGLDIAKKHNYKELQSNILHEIGLIVYEQNPAAAPQYLEEALTIAKEMGNRTFMIALYESMAAMYKQTGKYKEALEITELKQKITDSIFSKNKSAEINGFIANYELEKSNNKVKDLEVKNAKRTAQRNLLLGIAIGVAMLFVVLFFFTRRSVMLNRKLRAQEASLQELNNMKDKLFSIIAHDMRGPVARIPVILDIFEDEETPADEKQFLLDNLRTHTVDLIDMLEKLLLWGQSLMKGIILQQGKVNLRISIEQDLSLKKLTLEEKDINVTDTIPDGLHALTDPTHFDFIIRNLLTNAVKYSHHGGNITIAADTRRKPGYVTVMVKDEGMGIAPDVLPRIFSPVSSTPGTSNEKGTGIGLMLCKEFAVLNGGEIWVESEEGRGATFFLALREA